MPPGDRGEGRRDGTATGILGGGFGGFPELTDPFEGCDMFGGGAEGRSVIEEFFGRDLFDDPFSQQPFGGLFGTPGSLFNYGGNLV